MTKPKFYLVICWPHDLALPLAFTGRWFSSLTQARKVAAASGLTYRVCPVGRPV